MATYLYRLGRFAARRAWLVILTWVLLLGLVGGAAGLLSKPLTTQLTIPNTEFQDVLDDLKAKMPDAGGGTGTILFRTADGQPFTAEQKTAVGDTMKQWRTLDQVTSARNPFTTQKDLDKAAKDVKDGKKKLADGKDKVEDNTKKLTDAEKKLDDGQDDIDQNAKDLAKGKTQLASGELQASAGQAELTKNAATLATAKAELEKNAVKLSAGRAEIAKNQKKLDNGQTKLDAAQKKIDTNQSKLDQGKKELAANKAQIDQARAALPKLDAGIKQAKQGYDQAKAAGAPEAQLAPIQQQITELTKQRTAAKQGIAQYDAAAQQLKTGQAQLNAGQQTLDANQKKLTAGQRQLDAAAAQITTGEKQLAAGRIKIADGEAKVAAGQAQLDSGRVQIDQNKAKLAAGEEKLSDGQREVNDGRKDVSTGKDKLSDARDTIAKNEVTLNRGERQIALIDGMRSVNEDGNAAVAQVAFEVAADQIEPETREAIPDLAADLAGQGVLVDYSSDLQDPTGELVGPGEIVGVVVAGIVLLIMLGSLLAAGLPLLTALIGVGVGLLGVLTATHWFEMASVTPILALMLGLAVGIDYALFLVNRHRQQLADGVELRESIARANGTAGSAVTVAGLTVIVALAALVASGIPFLGTMGLAAAATVAVAVLLSLTLTPALLRVIGHRVLSRRGRRALQAQHAAQAAEASTPAALSRGKGWGGLVTRHPVITTLIAAAILGSLALPAQALRLGLPDGSVEPEGSTAYTTYSVIADEFGPGQNATVVAVAQVPGKMARELTSGERTDLSLDIAERLRDTPGVAYVLPAGYSDDRTRILFQIVPQTGPSDEATSTVVNTLRQDRDTIVDDTGIRSLGFAGQTVANIDMSKLLADALPGYLAIVVGISLLLLAMVFRSIVVPLLATAGFLLSIAAAFGSVVMVFQWGWAGWLFGVDHPGPVLSFLPTLAIGIVFGLAMDYQMFMVSGMREAWAHGQNARDAVRTGFSQGARVVTAAALIMTAVFSSFVFSPSTMIRPIGFALAVGVLLDAFVVRMTLMPAVMHLLGEKAWYLPRWLDKLLPDLDVEGTKLVDQRQHPEPAPEAPTRDRELQPVS